MVVLRHSSLPFAWALALSPARSGMVLSGQRGEQRVVLIHPGVAGGEELLAIEDRIGAGDEAQDLRLARQKRAPRGQAHARLRHNDSRRRDHAHKVERVERGLMRERRSSTATSVLIGTLSG